MVDADDVEPGPVVAHGGAAGAAEQVEQPGPHAASSSSSPRALATSRRHELDEFAALREGFVSLVAVMRREPAVVVR